MRWAWFAAGVMLGSLAYPGGLLVGRYLANQHVA